MKDVILKAEGVSKQYRLGLIGTGTLSHDLNRWWHRLRGKEDPYLKIGESNDRSTKGNSQYVWALRDINFEVKRGEVLGIIGKNGAGKSTLLKILSRVTLPTTGDIKTKGRIASLLEVGTGFHPEMTGRENIFLNGAILGMTKKEIASKLDEIIEFSGCERYIDTPVKRYSSGMRVRLAFAVAAHLEPDILVVDEVLAVGDAEFQKKAIGKMQDISQGQGRTVLFVSHNMAAIRDLCTRAIVLNNGVSVFSGAVNKAIEFYLKDNANANSFEFINTSVKTNDLITLHLMNAEKKVKGVFGFEEVISLAIKLKLSDTLFKYKPLLGIRVSDKLDRNIFTTEQSVFDLVPPKDEILIKVDIPNSLLVPNDYNVSLGFHIPNKEVIFKYDAIVSFEIEESGFSMYRYVNRDLGCVFVNCDWIYLDEDSHNK